jgi:hypothetical protein
MEFIFPQASRVDDVIVHVIQASTASAKKEKVKEEVKEKSKRMSKPQDAEWASAVETYRRKMLDKREAEAKVKSGLSISLIKVLRVLILFFYSSRRTCEAAGEA